MFNGYTSIEELVKISAQFTMDEIFQQYLKKLKKRERTLTKDKFLQLVNIDPTYEGDNEQGSYTHWILNQFLNDPKVLGEDAEKINEHLNIFHKVKNKLEKKDINQYKSDAELYEAISPYIDTDLRSNREKLQVDTDDYHVEYEDDLWIIYIPLTWAASVMLGKNTNWCTAANSDNGEDMFESYFSDGPLYILVDKNDPNHKYQFHFETGQFMDKNDSEIDLGYYLTDIFSSGISDWFIDKLNLDITDFTYENSISDDLIEIYDDDEPGAIQKETFNIIFKNELDYIQEYTFEILAEELNILPEDNIDEENFNYKIAYEVLIDLFENRVENAFKNSILGISLYPNSDTYSIYIDEEIILTYFLNNILNERYIHYYDLMEKGLVPDEFEPILKDNFKKLYKQRITFKTDKELVQEGQGQLFDDIDYIEEFEEEEIYANIKNIDELIFKYGELMKPTLEMKEYFDKRTEKHINLVKKYCKKIHDFYGDRFEGIIDRGETHDQSKYKDPEIVPYIYITWDYKCKDDGVDFEISEEIEKNINTASEHHVNNNKHHPEYHCENVGKINKEDRDAVPDKIIDATKMSDLDIAEMCADWCSMSEERGNSPIEWADKNVGKRWKFNDDKIYLIYEILNDIWEN